MNKLLFSLLFFLPTSYMWAEGNVLRDLQHEIDEINIMMTSQKLTKQEWDFLRGKSFGLFVAIEIVMMDEQKKTPSNGKSNRGKNLDFLNHDRCKPKILQ